MEARHLRYALALAEHQHFGRAAAALGIAQPPLSTQIAALEKEVGERLFERTSRGVFPTAAGDAFLARAERALQEMTGAAVDAGRAARGETGRLRIGFIGSALLDPLPTVLAPFRRAHPEVRLSMTEAPSPESTSALLAGSLDVAVGRGAPTGPGAETLVTVSIKTDDLVAVVAATHPFAGQRQVGIEQLSGDRLIISPPESEPRVAAVLRELFPARSLEEAISARDVHTIVGLAACEAGVGLGPSGIRRIDRRDVRFCRITPAVRLPDLHLSFRAHDPSPVLANFLQVLRHNCAQVGNRLDRTLTAMRVPASSQVVIPTTE
ncbi:LysR family transcriptional regulator [Actinoplanes sp. NBRC 103695]|uniref:LysR family transcriptional regulator n=1 Tax=Actinoplanes sp. NBRC 103695 TaxID=3032202 RepID=UPI0024A4081E|nr:LysR family transcriptional regulator [Actinoplanes sp. NBRC 103695]GLY97279.1 LysR family transcriptional regulator [Actinoplanes sp. NBRC 103695]